uniref:Uncharacterized protein n=1 Tax=Oryza sativa subsp. japonica TaxID=39947 RepID=Q5N826_ORYSJ|nr:hypothetical protein [Oryza sativa Japonica Group]BAD82364.1 hypothetical protein [Oryza sativa Japonica Group]
MARIIRRHGGGRILRRSREEKRRLSEGGGGASQQPQGPAEDDYCPVIGSKVSNEFSSIILHPANSSGLLDALVLDQFLQSFFTVFLRFKFLLDKGTESGTMTESRNLDGNDTADQNKFGNKKQSTGIQCKYKEPWRNLARNLDRCQEINMDGISDQEVANAYSFVFSFDEALRSIKLEEGRLLIHIADLYEMKRSLDDKITSLKAAVKSSPSADILRRIKSTRTKNNETQEEIYADKSLLAKTRLKLVKLEESPRSWRISIDEVAVVADSDGDADVNAEQLLHLLEHVGAIGENTSMWLWPKQEQLPIREQLIRWQHGPPRLNSKSMNSFDTCCLSTATIATAADDDDGNNAVNGAGSCTAAASHERYSGRRRGHGASNGRCHGRRRGACCGGTKYEPLIGSDLKANIRRYRQLLGMVPHHDREVEGQADWKISSRSHGGRLAISSLHRDGEAARSELKHADDAPPLNTDGDHWHYRRRSREDEAAPFPPSSIRGSPIRRNISIQISSPGTRFSHQGLENHYSCERVHNNLRCIATKAGSCVPMLWSKTCCGGVDRTAVATEEGCDRAYGEGRLRWQPGGDKDSRVWRAECGAVD